MQGSSSQPTIEQLLTHAAWVQQLARRLVQDDERAGDVVQDAWVKAIEHPPILAADASPRPWLKVVVRNLVAQLGRDTTRREQREREAARPEAVAPVDRAVAREAARREVVEAVFELPEPYREAIVLRYFDELSPSAIAERLRVPGSTVRSRLQRAHEMLRARLAATDDDQRRSLALVLAPLINARTSSIPLAAGAILVSTKLVVLSACAAAAVLLVAWTLLHSSPSNPTSLANDQDGAMAALAPSTADSSDAAAHDADQLRVAIGDSDPRAASPTAASAARRIRIVRADTDAPIADARVHWASAKEIEAKQAELLPHLTVDIDTQIPLLGHELSSDAGGFVALPEVERTIWVAGEHGELWASSYFAGTGPLDEVLALNPDAALLVQVVDADGVPIEGVPITAARTNSRDHQPIGARTEGRAGIAMLAHAAPRLFGGRRDGTLTVDLGFPHVFATAVVVDASPWPSEPVRLTCPAVGSVRVKLVDVGGLPYIGRVQGDFNATAPKGAASRSAIIETRNGELVLDQVGVGLTLSISALPIGTPGGWRSHGGLDIDGPKTAGEEVVAEFRVVNDKITVNARALDDAGVPMRNIVLQAQSFDASGTSDSQTSTRTDENGLFKLLVDAPFTSGACPQLEIVAQGRGTEANVALPSCAMSSTIDLGELRFSLAPLLATGRVTDVEHAPIAGATVALFTREGDGTEHPELAKLGYVTVEWEPIWIRNAGTGADGRFEVRGTERGHALSLRASANGFTDSRYVEFAPGAKDLELALARELAGELVGRLHCSHPAALDFIWVQARSAGGANSDGVVSMRPDRSGRFRLRRVPKLPVDLCLGVDASSEPLMAVAGIASVDDPRLRSIDIDALVHVYEIDVESSLGAPVLTGRIAYGQHVTSTISLGSETPIDRGHTTIASTEPNLALEIESPGFRHQAVTAAPGPIHVVLRPGFDVVLRVSDSLAITEPGFSFEVHLSQVGHVSDNSLRVQNHGDREFHARLPRDGGWTLDWILVDEMLNGRENLQSDTITVGDALPAPISELTVARSDLDARVAKWLTHHKR